MMMLASLSIIYLFIYLLSARASELLTYNPEGCRFAVAGPNKFRQIVYLTKLMFIYFE